MHIIDKTAGRPDRSAQERAEIRRIRRSLEQAMDRLLAMLDALDADSDLEPNGDDELNLQPMLRGGVDARAA